MTEEAAAEEQDPLQDNDPWINAQLPESLPTHSNTTDSWSVYGSVQTVSASAATEVVTTTIEESPPEGEVPTALRLQGEPTTTSPINAPQPQIPVPGTQPPPLIPGMTTMQGVSSSQPESFFTGTPRPAGVQSAPVLPRFDPPLPDSFMHTLFRTGNAATASPTPGTVPTVGSMYTPSMPTGSMPRAPHPVASTSSSPSMPFIGSIMASPGGNGMPYTGGGIPPSTCSTPIHASPGYNER